MKSSMNLVVVISIFFIFLSVHAAENQDPQWKGKIEEENGVKVIKNPDEPLYGEITFELEEDLVIGNEKDENSRFYKWLSLDVDRDGNIYVLDRGSFRIQKFDKKGKYLKTIGREGQGPGEFSQPNFISLDEKGNVYVKDGTKAHIIDIDGQFVRSFPIPLNSDFFKITKEGNFLGERMIIMPPDKLSEDVVLMNDKGTILKEIASFPSIRMDSMFNRKDRFAIQVPELCFCPSMQDYAVYGFPSEYRLFVVDSSGEVKKIIVKDEPAEKISGKERNKIIDVLMDNIKSRKSARQEPRGELEKKVLILKFRPFFDEIRLDEEGNIYAEKLKSYLSEDKGYEFDFFNKEGYYLYKVKIPEGIANINVIKWGCVFSAPYNRETGYFQVKRYKIKNWEQIKTHTHF